MCRNAGGTGGGRSSAQKVSNTSSAALSAAQNSIISRISSASQSDDRAAYRQASAEFVDSLGSGDVITEFQIFRFNSLQGGEISGMSPTVWVKNADNTISRKGSSEKETATEWARRRWRSGGSGGNFLKGDLTPNQIADELSKIEKKRYQVRERKK